MDITIIRHGTTPLNEQGRYQGSRVDPDLSVTGREFVEKVGQVFDAKPFDVVISSPLKRAVETARILVGSEKEIQTDGRIRETDFGEIDGKKPGNLREEHPDVYDFRGLSNDLLGNYIQDVESWAEIEVRLDSFFKDLINEYNEENILLVCHGGIIRAICAHFFGGTMLNFDQVDNVSETKIHLDETADFYPRLVEYNRKLV